MNSYAPYGDLISSEGSFDTAYGYTGELSDSSGLINLRARWYDTSTGRFISKDTWAGDYQNPITLGKWLYANANPVMYTDPSGKMSIVPLARFINGEPYTSDLKPDGTPSYTRTYISPGWKQREINSIYGALWDVAFAYSRAYKNELITRYMYAGGCWPYGSLVQMLNQATPYKTFLKVHGGPITFIRLAETTMQTDRDPGSNYWAVTRSPRKILVYSNATTDNIINNPRWIVHEVGHALENAMLETIGQKAGRENLPDSLVTRDTKASTGELYAGFAGGSKWQYSPSITAGEIFADMFTGWVYNRWEVDANNSLTITAQKRSDYMNENMPGWITDVILNR